MSALPLQTYASPGRPLWQPFGTTSAVSSFTDASISSLTVSSINGLPADQVDSAGWSFFPAVQNVDMSNLNIDNVSQINANNTIYVNVDSQPVIIANNSTLTVPGGVELFAGTAYASLVSANTIRGGSAVLNGLTNNILFGNVGGFSTIATSTLTANTIVALSTINAISTISTTTVDADILIGISTINGIPISSFINPTNINASSITTSSITTSSLNAGFLAGDIGSISSLTASTINAGSQNLDIASISSLTTSTINGIEFVGGGGGSITLSSITSEAFSTIGASIKQGLMSSIVINPQINPTFNVDLGMGNFLTTLGTGLFGVAVAVPTTAGTITYGLTKGLASLFEPKPVLSNIAITSNFEVYNYQTQLQVSTLGHYVSTIYQFTSTIPSTIVINTSNINSTIDFVDVPYFISTISQSSTPTCIRSFGDPTTTVSTPWTYSQSLPEWGWVELPSSIAGGGGIGSNVSTLSLSTLTLAPSTIVKGDLDGAVMEVLEAGSLTSYGEVKSAGYWTTLSVGDPNFGIYTMNSNNAPSWINSNLSSFQFALQNTSNTFSTINASKVVAGGVNASYPLVSVVPDLDEWVVLGMSTMSGGGVGLCEVINTTQTGTGQLTLSAPNNSNGGATRLMNLDSSNMAVGILNASPQAPLDVGGLNYASPGSVGIFGSNRDGTLELTLQNTSAGSNASAFFFAVDNTGGEYAGFGQNSLNLSSIYNTLFELPGSAVMSGTLDCVIGPQSDHSSNSGIYLTYQDGANAWNINSNGAVAFNASYSNNVLNPGSFGTSNSILQTNGSGATPTWTSNITVNQVSTFGVFANSVEVSTLTVNNYIDFGKTDFNNQAFLVGGVSNHPVIETEVIASPYIDTITYIQPLTNSNATAGFIAMGANSGLVGINKIPEPGFVLDVDSTIRTKVGHFTGSVYTSSIFAPSTFMEVKSAVGTIDITPAGGSYVAINSGVVAGDQQGLIKFGQSEVMIGGYNGGENYIANQYYPGYYSGGSWTNYAGRSVRVEYAITTDSSFSGGLGKAELVLPLGISTLASMQATYVAFQDSSPGLTHPTWLYSTINDANGQISTIQVGGGQNTDLFVSILGIV